MARILSEIMRGTFCPAGTSENSPAIYRRETVESFHASPEGTTEHRAADFSCPSGTLLGLLGIGVWGVKSIAANLAILVPQAVLSHVDRQH